jgi:Cu/Ag efflux protein CusF
MKKLIPVLFATLLAGAPALAQERPAAALTGAEVRRIDKAAQKITLRHEPIKSLDMPAMTMVFRVKDAAMLEQVKAGDKVRFAAEKAGGQLTVTEMRPAE